MKKKILLSLLVIFALLASCLLISCGNNGNNGMDGIEEIYTDKIISRDCDFYVDKEKKSIQLGFFETISDVPLISIDNAVSTLTNMIKEKKDSTYEMTVTKDGNRFTLTRENGSYAIFDFDKKTLFFEDYNEFNMFSYELGSLDILDSDGYNADGESEYFKRVLSSEKSGVCSTIDFGKRQLPLKLEGDVGYMTLQTFSDIFLMPFEVMISYNGESAFLLGQSLLEGIENIYYKEGQKARSEELININYKHICLLLDFHYGLFKQHNISCADSYIEQIGLKESFLSQDTSAYFSAIKTLTYKYLSDNHSGALFPSPYNPEPNSSIGANEASIGYWEFYRSYQTYSSYRAMQIENGLKGYEEIGNTAFITFDTFKSNTVDYYKNSPVNGDYYDEIGLISYAHAMITREDSPIENVVIDLATNTGGHMDGGIYLVSWVLGNATVHINDPIRNAEGTYMYRADVNLDGVFDQNDTISHKKVYLITSPITFSCANYVTAAFKEAGTVGIIGMTSGGGGCCVYFGSTVDGCAIAISSSLSMSTYKNGSYYSVDQGIAPDYKIADTDILFNHSLIGDFINSLNQ